jgi:AcrR family transcriptional regulator
MDIVAKAPLRADALRNRDRIVSAARQVFAAQGPQAALDEIARTAGVGNATLYRHFPCRADLMSQVMREVIERIAGRAQAALDEGRDAFDVLSQVLLATIDEQVGALCTVLGAMAMEEDPELRAARDRLTAVTEQLVHRSQRSGALRADVSAGDLVMATARLTRPLPDGGGGWNEEHARRHLLIFLDGLRGPGTHELPGRAPTMEDFRCSS